MWKPQSVLLFALSRAERLQYFNRSRNRLHPQRERSQRGWYPSEHGGIVQPIIYSCSVSRRFPAYQSSRAGPPLFGEVWVECARSRECGCVAASLGRNPQRSPLTPPTGFHFKSLAFVQKCICSLILFGNYVKQKGWMVKRTILSPSLPSNLIPLPPLSLSSPTRSLPLSPSLAMHILLQMLMISPSVFWCKVCLHFPFHPHTNVLLLPVRPRAVLVAFLKYAVW